MSLPVGKALKLVVGVVAAIGAILPKRRRRRETPDPPAPVPPAPTPPGVQDAPPRPDGSALDDAVRRWTPDDRR